MVLGQAVFIWGQNSNKVLEERPKDLSPAEAAAKNKPLTKKLDGQNESDC